MALFLPISDNPYVPDHVSRYPLFVFLDTVSPPRYSVMPAYRKCLLHGQTFPICFIYSCQSVIRVCYKL